MSVAVLIHSEQRSAYNVRPYKTSKPAESGSIAGCSPDTVRLQHVATDFQTTDQPTNLRDATLLLHAAIKPSTDHIVNSAQYILKMH